jgi:predicted membrane protein
MNEFEFFSARNRRNSWYGLAIMVVVMILLFFLVSSLFKILYYLSPVLLLLTLIFDYKVVIKYGKMILRFFNNNWFFGLLLVVLTIFAFPFVTAGLFLNAFMNWRLKRAKRKYGVPENDPDKFSDFELIEEGEELDLSELEKLERKRK